MVNHAGVSLSDDSVYGGGVVRLAKGRQARNTVRAIAVCSVWLNLPAETVGRGGCRGGLLLRHHQRGRRAQPSTIKSMMLPGGVGTAAFLLVEAFFVARAQRRYVRRRARLLLLVSTTPTWYLVPAFAALAMPAAPGVCCPAGPLAGGATPAPRRAGPLGTVGTRRGARQPAAEGKHTRLSSTPLSSRERFQPSQLAAKRPPAAASSSASYSPSCCLQRARRALMRECTRTRHSCCRWL